MGLSSNSLIHLTKTKEALVGILNNDFKLKYCFEKIITSKGSINAAYPMVSFCDIPLSEIKNHISKYGSYGIGLKKNWAKKKGLNPVLYIDNTSTLGAEFRETSEILFKGKAFKDFSAHEIMVMNLFRYMKNYQEKLNRNGVIEDNYRYSDEREWRYILDDKLAVPSIFIKDYDTVEKKDAVNGTLVDFRLEFEPNDISYIIIESEEEISDFIDILRKSKSKKYSMNDIERLMTRMITTEQILSDF